MLQNCWSKDGFGDSISDVFPAMANRRSATEQAGYQLATLATTLGISILGGCGTGLLCSFLEPIDFEFTDKKWIQTCLLYMGESIQNNLIIGNIVVL